jgi:hypothetical protein
VGGRFAVRPPRLQGRWPRVRGLSHALHSPPPPPHRPFQPWRAAHHCIPNVYHLQCHGAAHCRPHKRPYILHAERRPAQRGRRHRGRLGLRLRHGMQQRSTGCRGTGPGGGGWSRGCRGRGMAGMRLSQRQLALGLCPPAPRLPACGVQRAHAPVPARPPSGPSFALQLSYVNRKLHNYHEAPIAACLRPVSGGVEICELFSSCTARACVRSSCNLSAYKPHSER